MKPRIFSALRQCLVFALLLTVAGIATAIPSYTESKQASSVGVDAKALKKLTELLENAVEVGLIPNGSVYIWRGGKMAWSTEVGYQTLGEEKPVDKDTIYRMFSMTKPVTAAAVMALVADGKVLLNDPISLYLPEFAKMQVLTQGADGRNQLTPAKNPIRVRDLLTHADGLTYDFIPSPVQEDYAALGISPGNPEPEGRKQPSLAAMVRDLATIPLIHEPGATWSYGVGLDVAGRLVEVVSGESFESFLKKRIFSPLGMKSATFSVSSRGERRRSLPTLYQYEKNAQGGWDLAALDSPQDSAWSKAPAIISGGGGMLSTAGDYMKFAVMLLHKGMGAKKKKQIIGRRAIEVMMSDHMSADYGLGPSATRSFFNPDGRVSGIGQGLGGAVQTNYARGAMPYSPGSYTWGGAAGTQFWVDPQEDLAVVFTTQAIAVGQADPTDRIQAQVTNMVYNALQPMKK